MKPRVNRGKDKVQQTLDGMVSSSKLNKDNKPEKSINIENLDDYQLNPISKKRKSAKSASKNKIEVEEEKKHENQEECTKNKLVGENQPVIKVDTKTQDIAENVEVIPVKTNISGELVVDAKISHSIKNAQLPSSQEKILDRSFFKQNILDLSRNLLGKIIVRKTPEGVVKCRIVETEAYCGIEDKACHAYGGKKTDKTKWMYEEGGHCYIFSIYGSNCCLNFTSGEKGDPSAVLIRATEPVEGLELIKKFRGIPKISGSGKELTNGPGKLCKAMNIDKSFNGYDATKGEDLYLIDDENYRFDVEISARINIDYAQEFIDKPWRYYIKKNIFVSVKQFQYQNFWQ